MSAILPIPAAEAAPTGRTDLVRSDQIRSLYTGGLIGILVTLIAAFVIGGLTLSHGIIDRRILIGWLAFMVVQAAVRVGVALTYRIRKPAPDRWRLWANLFILGALIGGLGWGFGSVLMMEPGHLDRQLMVVTTLCAIAYGAMAAFGSYLPAFLTFLLTAFAPLFVWSLLQNDLEHQALAGLLLLWIPAVGIMSRNNTRTIVTSLRLRYENLELLRDLQLQKEKAEQANVAKSRFLASASHDLRQPVHALGMFVGALRAMERQPAAQKLLNHIEDSVAALDNLFTSLLDISRLDAGVIEVETSVFPVRPLLDRIVRDHAAEAQVKGLTLTLVDCDLAVRSDPILLERIVRNLVSNAVRHTEAGGVVVGCRRRRNRIEIEVSDTGPGIFDEHREDIFQEFFQVANPGRDRSHGLGLGLAIVRRLTALLDHPLTLQSRPGRGSTLRVSAPAAELDHHRPEPNGPQSADLRNGLILVIDDETAIQEAMRSLLEAWGHQVIVAGSGMEILERTASCTRRPDLIISDYRLRDENGIEVIERLQSEFNHLIPAMLLTGDTAPDRLTEARASGFRLLHKPLSEARLRAAIGEVADI